MTGLAFHGITTPPPAKKAKSVTHVSGTKCHLCLGPLTERLPPSPPSHDPRPEITHQQLAMQVRRTDLRPPIAATTARLSGFRAASENKLS